MTVLRAIQSDMFNAYTCFTQLSLAIKISCLNMRELRGHEPPASSHIFHQHVKLFAHSIRQSRCRVKSPRSGPSWASTSNRNTTSRHVKDVAVTKMGEGGACPRRDHASQRAWSSEYLRFAWSFRAGTNTKKTCSGAWGTTFRSRSVVPFGSGLSPAVMTGASSPQSGSFVRSLVEQRTVAEAVLVYAR